MPSSRIVIVEDEAIVAMDIEDRLTAMGYQLAGRTANGEQALALVEQQRPDLILMDIRLRGPMDGITAAQHIRQKFHLPVIFLTAYSEDATLERAKQAEPFGYILKPFDDRELKSAIEIALYKHHAEEEIRRLNRLYDVLSQVNQTVVRAHAREDLFATVCRLMVERGAIDLAWIGWLDPTNARITPVAGHASSDDILSQAKQPCEGQTQALALAESSLREGTSIICNDCIDGACDPLCLNALNRFSFRSCAAFPIRMHHQPLGALNLCTKEAGFFQQREINLLEEVALDISFALEKIEGEAARAKAEEDLRESEERLRMALTASNQGLYDLNLRTGKAIVSPEYATMLGYDPAEFTESNDQWIERLHPEDKPLVEAMFQAYIAGQLPHYKVEFRQHTKDRQWKWILSIGKIVAYDDQGRPTRMLGTHTDITERKLAEEARSQVEAQLRQAQKMEALGTLAGGIAHDFNNILGIIFGFTELALMNWNEGKGAEEELMEVFKAANRAKDLVQQILAFSRMSEQVKKPLQLALIIKEAMKMLRATLPSTIEIRQNIVSKTIVMGDPTQIHQVLMNLCANAGYVMQAEGGVLEVSLTDERVEPDTLRPQSELKPGAYVKLIVRDTGQGMTADILERIFEPFFTTKELGVGTGLGLSVVHGIVKSHEGFIEVKSAPGKGTVFEVLLPAMKLTPLPESPLPERDKAEPALRGSERILVVDDEPALAGVLKKMLARLGYDVRCCTRATEALNLIRDCSGTSRIDMVITDMTMPEMTGVGLARRLLEIQPDLPILLCTGFKDKISSQEAASLGIRGVISKPVTTKELMGRVRAILDQKG